MPRNADYISVALCGEEFPCAGCEEMTCLSIRYNRGCVDIGLVICNDCMKSIAKEMDVYAGILGKDN